MSHVDFFKRQAKLLFKDYKTKTPYIDDLDGASYFKYDPKYFDVDGIILDYDFDEDDFSLMKAQHAIALMVGFGKWADLLKASEKELELTKLIFDSKVSFEDWESYIAQIQNDNGAAFDAESRMEIFKSVFIEGGAAEEYQDYHRLDKDQNQTIAPVERQTSKSSSGAQITSLPLSKVDRAEFIESANRVFESVMRRMEPLNPELTRKLWNVEDYIDNDLLRESMLPISKEYALSLIDAFLVHHVLGLAKKADDATART